MWGCSTGSWRGGWRGCEGAGCGPLPARRGAYAPRRAFRALSVSLRSTSLVAVPCFCCAGRSPLAKSRPLPLLRFGCFVRRTRLSCAVPHAGETSYALPCRVGGVIIGTALCWPCGPRASLRSAPLSVSFADSSPAGGAKVTPCHAGQVRQIKKLLYNPKQNPKRLRCRRFFFCIPADKNA